MRSLASDSNSFCVTTLSSTARATMREYISIEISRLAFRLFSSASRTISATRSSLSILCVKALFTTSRTIFLILVGIFTSSQSSSVSDVRSPRYFAHVVRDISVAIGSARDALPHVAQIYFREALNEVILVHSIPSSPSSENSFDFIALVSRSATGFDRTALIAVSPCTSVSMGFALQSSRARTQWILLTAVAHIRGVRPPLSRASTFPPDFCKNGITKASPSLAAMWMGVKPSLFR
mmetsp:Transcript_5354/g.8290  ORF Transcript_5354/g.8290 Transcript_5354/m.8290 type:complete len:237 (-) Transcript_5354:670-1380(-)